MIPDHIAALPCWQGDIRAQRLPGGLSNEIWKVIDAKGAHVARFGVDYPFHHVSRAREVMASRAAHAAGFAPAVEYVASGVMVTEFVTARTLTPPDIEPIATAHFLQKFHREMPEFVAGEAGFFWVFHVIRDYARTLRDSRYTADLALFTQISAALEAVQVPLPIVYAHNDLLPANFLDDGSRLWLIDYEYAGFSTALFDLAGVASNAEMSDTQAQVLLETYFNAQPDAALIRAFDAMQCASLLRETMWAMVSDLHLAAPGADYAAYVADNHTRLRDALAAYQIKHGSLTS
jgi:thiamine kinase-like enzyme